MSKTHAIKGESGGWVRLWCGKSGRRAPNTDTELDSEDGTRRYELAKADKATCGSCKRAAFGKWRG